jgi:Ca-activated chloride channel family protein
LGQISAETGGHAFPAGGMPLSYFAQKIITDLRNRYILGFSPTDRTRDGRYHHVDVKLVPPRGLPAKLNVHWRAGTTRPRSEPSIVTGDTMIFSHGSSGS